MSQTLELLSTLLPARTILSGWRRTLVLPCFDSTHSKLYQSFFLNLSASLQGLGV